MVEAEKKVAIVAPQVTEYQAIARGCYSNSDFSLIYTGGTQDTLNVPGIEITSWVVTPAVFKPANLSAADKATFRFAIAARG